jgi:plasmid stabilization system protein ParE
VAAYIQQEFGKEPAMQFVVRAFAKSDLVARYPEIGRKSKRFKTVRFVLLGKHHRMYYRVDGATLYVAYLFDTRQDPAKDRYR